MIFIIDNYDSFTYNLYQLVASFYDNVRVFRNDQITIADIKHQQPKGIILSPGPGRPEKAGICMDLIRAIVTGEIQRSALLGVCLGHQAIVAALGGHVVQANEIVHGKDDHIYHQQQGLYQFLSQPFKAGRYHSLIAKRETLPDTLLIEAENKEKLIMGIRHQSLPIYGVQFHPESILTPEGSQLLKSFIAICEQNEARGQT